MLAPIGPIIAQPATRNRSDFMNAGLRIANPFGREIDQS
jgi:hypothetical protein